MHDRIFFTVPDDVEVRVWDSSREMRYWVPPPRPANTEEWSEEQLPGLVTRNSIIGVGPRCGERIVTRPTTLPSPRCRGTW